MSSKSTSPSKDDYTIGPLTHGQRALWFLHEMDPGGYAYNMSYAWHIRSGLDVSLLKKCLQKLVDRHPGWRSTFEQHEGSPVQKIHRTMPLVFEEVDASDWDEDETILRVRKQVYRPFNLAKESPIRWVLFKRGQEDPVLFMGTHHMCNDVWSTMRILNELRTLYRAEKSGDTVDLPPLTVSNEDFVNHQNQWVESEEGQKSKAFWKEHLSGELPVLNLQNDKPRPPMPSFKGDFYKFALPDDVMNKLMALCTETKTSPFAMCLSAFQVYLKRYTNQNDLIVGVPTAGRDADFAPIYGYFVSPVAIRTQIKGNPTFREYLASNTPVIMSALEHQNYPFPLLSQQVSYDMDPSRSPIFQSSFVWENSNRFENRKDPIVSMGDNGEEQWDMGEMQWERLMVKIQLDNFDLLMKVTKVQKHFYGQLEYNPDLFTEETIARMANNFTVLLSGIADAFDQKLSELPLLSEDERKQVLVDWNNTDDPYPDLCGYQLFSQQAAERPDDVALVFENVRLTYRELNTRVNQLAHHLRSLGVGPDVLAGVSMPRSEKMIISLMAILKAGGAYVPLDPNYPEERIEYILEESKITTVLTLQEMADRYAEKDVQIVFVDGDADKIAQYPAEDPEPTSDLSHLSHIIYTSGSTGKPKGVAIEHRCVAALINWIKRIYTEEELSGILASTSLNFDISVYEIVGTLALGGKVILVENALYLPTAPAKDEVKLINTVPSAGKELVRMKGIPPSVITINLAGEPLKNNLVQALYRTENIQRVYNLYGPSEDTTYSTWALMLRGDDYTVMIGEPLTNTQAYVLDPYLNPVPVGVPGELYMAGHGLARGYLNRPDLSSERFISNPFSADPNARMYMTGDLVRYWADGKLECLGRIDHQVKIRGFRIELGEIEAVLNKHDAVRESIVIDREDKNGEKILVGYVTLHDGSKVTGLELREFIKEHLPEYMAPSFMVVLDDMPLNPNGKIDRKQLPEPQVEATEAGPTAMPTNEIERTIAEIWKEVLNLKTVGVNDKFFDLGGHSLLLAQVRFKLQDLFEKDIKTTDLFQYPTISSLARFLSPESGDGGLSALGRKKLKAPEKPDIAVIGIAGRFPGADDCEQFWDNLIHDRETITRFTFEELEEAGVDVEDLQDSDYVRARGILSDISIFDAGFFGYTPREAEVMDPQQRFFLEGSWTALENAGYNPDTYAGRIGVFAGCSMSTYFQFNIAPNHKLLDSFGAFPAMVANDKDFLATRVSYNFNLRGPGVTVQSACSTSLVAVHQACRSLLGGESDIALAGGVTIQVPQKNGYLYNEGGIHSPDGHVRTFDAKAKGMVVSSGMGIAVLKRLEEAMEDGDHIMAVVKGTAINNDGSLKVGYTAPSVEGQSEAIADAQAFAGINPETITYIETHGTATPMGDPIEIAALTRAFRAGTKKNGFCALGALKSNIGHLDSAAGIAGFIKTTLALHHKMMPAVLHFEKPNPGIDFESTPFYVNAKLSPWEKKGNTPRRAGVSAFGIGGTNAHTILEEAPAMEPGGPSRPHQLLLLSAKTSSALEKASTNLLSHLKNNHATPLPDAAFTLKVGRKAFEKRRFVVVSDIDDAIDALETVDAKRVFTHYKESQNRPIVFMFSGQGAQYVRMGWDLYRKEPLYKEIFDDCADKLRPHLGLDLRDLVYPHRDSGRDMSEEELKEAANKINQTSITQPALFVIEYALARLWMSWGIKPSAMIGHSIGEYVAACLAEVFTLDEALVMVAARGRLMYAQPTGSMLAIPMTEDKIIPYMTPDIDMATVNAFDRCVVAGPDDAIDAMEKKMVAEGLRCTRLHTSHAFHSAMMDSMLEPFTDEVAKFDLKAPKIPYISNVTGNWITAEEATDPGYYARHLRGTVRFAEGMKPLLENPDHIFLEVGPGKTLMSFAKRQLDRNSNQKSYSSVRHPKDTDHDTAFILNTLGQLWNLGCEVDWDHFYKGESRRRIPLPTYPFEGRRFWVDPVAPSEQVKTHSGPPRKKPDITDWFYTPTWKQTIPPAALPQAALAENPKKWLIFAGSMPFSGKLEARLQSAGQNITTVTPADAFGVTSEGAYTVDPGSRESYQALFAALAEADRTPDVILHTWNLTADEAPTSRLNFAEQCNDHGVFSLLFTVQAMDDADLSDPVKIIMLSNNMQAIAGEPHPHPEKSPMAGLCRVVPREFPHISSRSIDIVLPKEGSIRESTLIDQIIADSLEASVESVSAYRGPHRWLQSFDQVKFKGEAGSESRLRDKGVYMITGGLGGIGLELAKFIARSTKAKLVLTRRSDMPERDQWNAWIEERGENDKTSKAIAGVRALEAMGAEVMTGSADSADLEATRRVVGQAREKFGALNGVIHAAGLYPSGMIMDETKEMCARVMAPKVAGTLVLDEVLDLDSLDFLVLFSSSSAILGNAGFGDYAAANSLLDAYTAHASAAGHCQVLTMSWDGWKDVGMAMAKEVAPEHQELHERMLSQLMGPEEGIEAFRRVLLESPFGHIIISQLEFQPMLDEIRNFLKANLTEDNETETSSLHLDVHERPEIETGMAWPRNETESAVAELFKEQLGLHQIGIHDNFDDLGMDSLTGTMIASKLRRIFKIRISPKLITDEPTVERLSAAIDGLLGKEPAPPAPKAAAPVDPAPESAQPVANKPEPPKRQRRPKLRTPYVESSTETQTKLVEMWCEALGYEQVGINDNFLELGGGSELATQLTEAMNQAFEVDLPAGIPISEPTIAGLAERIETIRWASADVETDSDDEDDEEFEL